ncbi:GTPase [Arthrobacter sp. W4I7]|uniref:GTPase n=1 Tax=Arthrobacter sp. W4I7 TaxID=3042296 RepID=UPI002788F162|nr:GTPase [Arthrobacter sp. W4I7]MDQ0693194.1 50S ribosomal subunit-associated GTPase HflX [Arthrobacter sp. W4I7]
MTSSLETAILHLCDQFEELGGEPAARVTSDIRARLDRPLRLAVVGRVKAGKSTLVNALVGARVAATDEAECTSLVTHYIFDPPDRAEIILTEGESIVVNIIDGRLPDPLPVAIDKISPSGSAPAP